MDNSDTCYEVRFVNGQGNGLFATRDIVPGEMILKEFPFVWNAFKNTNHFQSSFCYTCGCSLTSRETRISCSDCQVNFCCKECQAAAELLGHRFMCPSYRKSGLVDSFTETDRSGHFALAFQCYAQIAAEYVTAVSALPTRRSSAEYYAVVKTAAHTILSGYHADDFCRSKHAIRTGKLDILSENMFETMIAPAYFSTSGLEDAQTKIYNAFATLPLSAWTNTCTQADTTECNAQQQAVRAVFLQTGEDGIFSPMFFRKLVGTFSVNNHHVHLQQQHGTVATHAATSETPSTVFTVVDTAGGVRGQLLQLLGTALYPTVSKMNHSCECNTTNSHSRLDVQLSVYATSHIAAGQELTTTYLHRRSGATKPQSRRSRHKALLQYLFACTCTKCEQELQQAREDRRARRAVAGKAPAQDDDSDSEESEQESSEDEEEGSEQDGNASNACY